MDAALVDVRDVHLDERLRQQLQRIEDRNAIEGEAGRIDDHGGLEIECLLDPIHEHPGGLARRSSTESRNTSSGSGIDAFAGSPSKMSNQVLRRDLADPLGTDQNFATTLMNAP